MRRRGKRCTSQQSANTTSLFQLLDQKIIRILLQQLKIKIFEALTTLQQLCLYEKQQNESDSDFLILLNKYKLQIQCRKMKERQRKYWLFSITSLNYGQHFCFV